VILPLLSVVLAACSLPGTAANSSASSATATPSAVAGIDQQRERAAAIISPSIVRIDNPGHGLGSGIVRSRDGYIVTNDHVVAGGRRFDITFANGHTTTATLVGGFPLDDLAVIKASASNLPAATFGNSSTLNVGQSVLAVGNPLGINFTVTDGIVSGLNRTVSEGPGTPPILNMVQTSASINPGNSGGALIDLKGEVIGIPTLAAVDPAFGAPANGVGFAVASNTVERIAPQLIRDGRVTNSGRAALGIVSETVTPELAARFNLPASRGVLVAQLVRNGAAEQAGIPAGSVIEQVDGKPVNHRGALIDALASKSPGDRVAVTIVTPQGRRETVHVTLGELQVGSE
jgi:S1-C subfamily serine protease